MALFTRRHYDTVARVIATEEALWLPERQEVLAAVVVVFDSVFSESRAFDKKKFHEAIHESRKALAIASRAALGRPGG